MSAMVRNPCAQNHTIEKMSSVSYDFMHCAAAVFGRLADIWTIAWISRNTDVPGEMIKLLRKENAG